MSRLLVVDDDPLLLRLYDRVLSDRFDVSSMTGGQDAVNALERGQEFDGCVLDFDMPGVNGAGVLAAMSRLGSTLGQHTVVVTGSPTAARATLPASIPILEKPFDGVDLVAVIGDLIAR